MYFGETDIRNILFRGVIYILCNTSFAQRDVRKNVYLILYNQNNKKKVCHINNRKNLRDYIPAMPLMWN